jgi:hypothetical protein
MKTKQLLLLMSVISTLTCYSQAYTFSTSSGTYADLVGGTSLNNNTVWDDPLYTVPFGFNFQYFNSNMSQIILDGNWGLGGDLTSGSSGGVGELLIPYGADLIDFGYDSGTSASNLSYLLTGNPGSQILKIEWNNVGFYEDDADDGQCTDYVNFQLWFYEGSNNIEIHFGPNSITQVALNFAGVTGPHIGLFPQYDYTTDDFVASTPGFVLTGNPASPTMIEEDSVYNNYLDGITPNGTIYKFTKSSTPTSINENENTISLYPNPVENSVTISGVKDAISAVTITNGSGQIVRQVSTVGNSIDLSELNAGFYFVQLTTNKGEVITKKIMKK